MSGMLSSALETPPGDEPKRRLTQWVFDAEANTLTERPGITAKGAPCNCRREPQEASAPPLIGGTQAVEVKRRAASVISGESLLGAAGHPANFSARVISRLPLTTRSRVPS